MHNAERVYKAECGIEDIALGDICIDLIHFRGLVIASDLHT